MLLLASGGGDLGEEHYYFEILEFCVGGGWDCACNFVCTSGLAGSLCYAWKHSRGGGCLCEEEMLSVRSIVAVILLASSTKGTSPGVGHY